jgi:S-formylglutathione hydrolase FrmB
VLVSTLLSTGLAQKVKLAPPVIGFPASVEQGKLTSTLMGREMSYRVVLPYHWKRPKVKRPVIYLLHGLSGHFNNWTDLTKLQEYASRYKFVIVTPEGDDGWYTDSASKTDDKYESYIIRELLPEIEKKYGTETTRETRAIAGLSMGGYGAIKFGLKYPDMFSLAGSFSGFLATSTTTEKEFPGVIGRTINSVFGPVGSPTRSANDTFAMIREATPEKIKTFPFLYLDCGTEDFTFKANRDFAALLVEKKVPHEFRQLPGGHDWKYWNTQLAEFLEVADKRIRASWDR